MNLYGLLGHKLSHSISPLVHKIILDYAGLNGKYKLFEREEKGIPDLLDDIILCNIKGINVTIPYKETVFKMVKEISPEAKAIGAMNTICLKDNKLTGYNTDYYGFTKALECGGISAQDKRVVVLGSGGSSKAVCYALSNLGTQSITIVSRSPQKGKSNYNMISYNQLPLAQYDILVNTTPVGMYPNADNCPIHEDLISKADAVVDLIYRPKITKLLSYANKHNIRNVNGLYMLVAQAVKAQSIWNEICFKNEDIKKIYNQVLGGYDFG